MFRFPRLAPFGLALCAFALSAGAQDLPNSAAAEPTRVAAPANSPESLATAARNILELVEVHNFRMRRIDDMIAYFAGIPDQDKVRQFSLLREREQNQYQQSLETYRRMLGDADFARVAGLLRNHFEQSKRGAAAGDDERRRHPGDQVAERDAAQDTAAQRAERVRLLMAAQAAEARERAGQQAARERGQVVARMRASQRAQLAQRLAQARAEQLHARAAAEQRYQPVPESPSNRRADPSQGGYGRGGNNQGRGRSPWQQQPQRR